MLCRSLILLILVPEIILAADTCDDACWRQRIYELQLQQTIQNQQKNARDQAIEESQKLAEQQRIAAIAAQQRQEAIELAKKNCIGKNLNQATFEERRLCQAVEAYYRFGLQIPRDIIK